MIDSIRQSLYFSYVENIRTEEYWHARLIECEGESGDYKDFISSLTEPEQYPADSLRYEWLRRVETVPAEYSRCYVARK